MRQTLLLDDLKKSESDPRHQIEYENLKNATSVACHLFSSGKFEESSKVCQAVLGNHSSKVASMKISDLIFYCMQIYPKS